jgi:hypothetical protein
MEGVALVEAKPVQKFYIFDRDDTLIDKNGHLINPHVIVPFVQMIDREESLQWAIASAGAIGLQEDDGYKALLAQTPITKKPVYILFNGMSSLIAAARNIDGVDVNWDENEKNRPDATKAQIVFNMLLDDHFLKLNTTVSNEKSNTTFIYNEKLVIQFQFGNTTFFINAEMLLSKITVIVKGDCKLFFILQALDSAKLKPVLTDGLKHFGIQSIDAPRDYQEIAAKDVVFLDDKKGNCDAVAHAGFTAIVADTAVASEKRGYATTDTYLGKLQETIPNETTLRNVLQEINSSNLDTLSPEKITAQRNHVLTEILKFDQGMQNLEAINFSGLGRLFDYSRFSLLKGFVSSMKPNDQLKAIADHYIQRGIYHKTLADFLVQQLCQDWKRPGIQEKVKAIVNIKPAGQGNLSTIHFRMAYMGQYQSEFFSNPFSSMRKEITRDPAAFDQKSMEEVKQSVTDKNGRSNIVLTALGAR